MKRSRLLVTFFAALLLSSCSSLRPVPSGPGAVPKRVRAEDATAVNDFFAKGGKYGFHPAAEAMPQLTPQNSGFIVDLDAQLAYLYHGDRLIAASRLSSGRKYYRTETGEYTIGQKDLNHRSTSYGNFVSRSGSTIMSDVQNGFDPTPVGARFEGSLMKWFMRFHYNGKPTAMGFHRGVLPGYPASHGCVRLPGSMAEWFFNHVALGTPVSVQGTKNGIPIGKSQGRPKRSPKVHSSLKAKPKTETPAVPPAPESDVKTPEPSAPAPAPESTPAPAPAPVETPVGGPSVEQ